MIIYPDNLPNLLDFPSILHELSVLCISPKAAEKALELQPKHSKKIIETSLFETREFLLSLQQKNSVPLSHYPDIDKELILLKVENAVLQTTQIHKLRKLIASCNELILFLNDKEDIFPHLVQKLSHIEKDQFLTESINNVINTDGTIRDDASETLSFIRKQIQENRKHIDRVYRIHIQRLRKEGQLADIEENYINGRRVLGVLAEYKRENKGIMQGQSSSGKITYIEPQNAVELNNDKLALEEDERKEIHRILQQLTDIIRPYKSYLKDMQDCMIEFDLCAAKAKLALQMNATVPVLSESNSHIQLTNAFHPLLYLQNKRNQTTTVPFSCTLDQEKRIMVISGPNAGGKSITLKTIGLLQLMLQSGLLIPASARSEMGIKQQLMGDIGDSQSIEDGLSTYSSRLLKMKQMIKKSDANTLFLIDEFGTGSDPDLGGALAEVILNRLANSGAQGVVTTHFTNLKLLANHHDSVFNACMLFHLNTLKPLYQLQIGEPGSSFTFEVAEKIGLPLDIIHEAKEILSSDKIKMDKLLHQLQKEKNQILKLKRDLQKQMSKTTAEKREYIELTDMLENTLEKTRANRDERQKLIEYGKKLYQLTQEWIDNKDKKPIIQKFIKLAGYEYALKKQREAFEKTEQYKVKKIAAISDKISIGTKVKIMNSRETGIIQSLNNQRATVRIGRIDINIGIEKLEPYSEKPEGNE